MSWAASVILKSLVPGSLVGEEKSENFGDFLIDKSTEMKPREKRKLDKQ